MSDMIQLTFPDGAVKEFSKGTTTEEIAQSISPGLRKKALAGKVGNQLVDLKWPISQDGSIAIITPDSDEALEILRHSTAHLLAQAVKRIYPDAKLGVGPAIAMARRATCAAPRTGAPSCAISAPSLPWEWRSTSSARPPRRI